MIFYPKTNEDGYGGLHDCCMEPQPPQPGGGGHMNIEGFVCEFYAAPGTFAIGTGRTYDEAEQFCADYYGGHLASIHSQRDYDTIAKLSKGYTQPLMLGLKSDAAGNWAWADGSHVDADFLVAHSFDGLKGVDETVGVFYPPICQDGWTNGVQSDSGDCPGDTTGDGHADHALHDWGQGQADQPMAFVCSSSGTNARVHLGSTGVHDGLTPGGGH